jgi:polyisoprenyl-phosphate glycosyltransferase
MKLISIVLPIFNEEENLSELYGRITRSLAEMTYPYEVIAVNDGSTDNSDTLLRLIHAEDSRWKIVSFSRNFGHQMAVSAGIEHSAGDAIVVMDSDLQDPPEELGRFLAKWEEGFDVVYAIRTRRKENIVKRAAYYFFYRLLKTMSNLDIPLDSGDFCVMDRKVAKVLRELPERTRFVRALRCWTGFKQTGLEYERHSRWAGEPKYNFTKLCKLAFDGITSFSAVPLRFSSWFGILFCGLAFATVILFSAWWTFPIPIFGMQPRNAVGWTSLVCFILILSGIQLLMIGILGEYQARIYEEVKGRKPWIVANLIGFENSPSTQVPELTTHVQ